MKKRKNFLKTSIGKKITFLAVIPARGNSQRIKNKNLIKYIQSLFLISFTSKQSKISQLPQIKEISFK